MRKSSVLFLALLLPVLIFMFLRFFGKNEFSIPVFHERAIENQPAACDQDYELPYSIPNASAIRLSGVTVVFFVADLPKERLEENAFQMSRLKNQPFGQAITTVWVDSRLQHFSDWGISPVVLDSASYHQERTCIYLMQSNAMVLIDSSRQIRGYYKEASLKETDRLIMELKILFNKY